MMGARDWVGLGGVAIGDDDEKKGCKDQKEEGRCWGCWWY